MGEPWSLVHIPRFIYGTAGKKGYSADLTAQAIRSGFRGIDVAAQPKDYEEELVGDGIRTALAESSLVREDLYIQTKYVPPIGQVPTSAPYALSSPLPVQILTSLKRSLHNLRPPPSPSPSPNHASYLDLLILDLPLPSLADTLLAWRTLELCVPHPVRRLGVSNIDLPTLRALYASATQKPLVVQNRFRPGHTTNTDKNKAIRQFCKDHAILYQIFWALHAPAHLLTTPTVTAVARSLNIVREAAFYLVELVDLWNVAVLNGPTDSATMKADLETLMRWKWRLGMETGNVEWEERMGRARAVVVDGVGF